MEEEYDLLSSKEKKELLSKVNKLKKKEHLQIFKIIQDTDISYSENSNGIFINLNNVTETVLKEIKEFVDICYKNNIEYDERKKQMEKLCEEFEQSNSTKNVETLSPGKKPLLLLFVSINILLDFFRVVRLETKSVRYIWIIFTK